MLLVEKGEASVHSRLEEANRGQWTWSFLLETAMEDESNHRAMLAVGGDTCEAGGISQICHSENRSIQP